MFTCPFDSMLSLSSVPPVLKTSESVDALQSIPARTATEFLPNLRPAIPELSAPFI